MFGVASPHCNRKTSRLRQRFSFVAETVVACEACKASGKVGIMRQPVPGRHVCDTCSTTIDIRQVWDLPKILEDTRTMAERNYPRIRDPLHLGTHHLREQFQDAYLNLLYGRYNAAIVTLSVFIESLVREAIFLQRNVRYDKPMGSALAYCRTHKVLRVADIHWLEDFKDKVRNVWLHQDIERIAGDVVIPGWVIEFPKENPLKGLNEAIEEIRAGKRREVKFRARDHPWAMEVAKQIVAQRQSFGLYESVWDFTARFQTRYLKQEAYDAWRGKHGKPDPKP